MSQPDARREGVPSLAEIFFGRLANFWRARRARRGRRTSRPRFETLENRLLLSADLIFNAPVDSADDIFTLRFNSDTGNLEVLDGGVLAASQTLVETTGVIIINGEVNQSDTLTIDFGFGGPFSVPGGITFNGGTGISDLDKLVVMGGSFTTATHTFTTTGPEHSGNMLYDDGAGTISMISYTGLEPIDMSGSTIENLVFNLPGTNDQAILEDDAVPGNGVSQLRSQAGGPTFDTTAFSNPTTLTVNMGGDDGTFTVASPDATFTAALTINGQGGAADTVTLTSPLTLASLSVTAESIFINGGSVTTTGNQSYNGAVALGAATTFSATGAAGVIAFNTSLAAGANAATISAREINLPAVGDTVSGTGTLTLQPDADTLAIVVGGTTNTAALDITDDDIAALANGFGLITIGRTAGTGLITVDGALFKDALTLRTGGAITISGTLTTNAANDSGALTLNAGGTTSINANANVNVNAGTGAINAPGAVLFSGSGTRTVTAATFNAGSLTINNSAIATLNATTTVTGALNLSSGALEGTGNVTVGGLTTFTGGTMEGPGDTITLGALTISGNVNLDAGRLLDVRNGGSWSGNINLNPTSTGGAGSILNRAGSVFEAGAGAVLIHGSLFGGEGGPASLFTNEGEFRKTGTGVTEIRTPFNNSRTVEINSGKVEINSGTLNLTGSGSHTGSFSGAGTLQFAGGTHDLQTDSSVTTANATFTGNTLSTTNVGGTYTVTGTTRVDAGLADFTDATLTSLGTTLIVTGGTANLGGANATLTTLTQSGGVLSETGDLTVTTFSQSGGTLSGTGNLTVSGLTTFTGGTMAGPGDTITLGALTINGNVNLDRGRLLDVRNGASWSGNINLNPTSTGGAGSILNRAGSAFEAGAGAVLIHGVLFGGEVGAPSLFTNEGTFRKTAGTGVTEIRAPFNNNAQVEVQTGTLSLDGGGTHTGSFSGAGTMGFGGGTHALGAATSITTANATFSGGTANINGTYNVAGTTRVSGGTANFLTPATDLGTTLIVTGGTANLGTTNDALTTLTVGSVNGGTLSSAGTLTVSGITTLAGAGTITGSGTLTANGPFTWSDGTMSGSGTTNANGDLNINTIGQKTLSGGRVLNTAGATTWSGSTSNNTGEILVLGGSSINNSGTWTDQHAFLVRLQSSTGGGSFDNDGIYTKSGAGRTDISIVFNNTAGGAGTGVVNVNAGTLALGGGGTSSGSFSGAGTLEFAGGTHTLGAASSITTANATFSNVFGNGTTTINGTYNVTGTTRVTGGTVTFNTPAADLGTALIVTGGTANLGATNDALTTLTVGSVNGGTLSSAGTLTVSGITTLAGAGTITGSGTLTANGPFTWSDGTMSGSGTTNANGDLNINTIGQKTLSGGRVLNTAGATTWSGSTSNNTGEILVLGGSSINNSGTWTDQHAFLVRLQSSTGGGSFDNDGIYTKSGAGRTEISVDFDTPSAGVVNVNAGTLALDGGGTHTGSFATVVGTTLEFGGGTHNLNNASAVSSLGRMLISGGMVNTTGTLTTGGLLQMTAGTLDAGGAVDATTYSQSGGTLTGVGTVSVSGLSTWTGGTMSGTGTTNTDGGLNISTNAQKTLTTRTLNTAGTTTWSGSTSGNTNEIIVSGGSIINNSGTWNDQNAHIVRMLNNGGVGNEFNNNGTYTRSGAAGETQISIGFDNAGVVNVNGGTLSLDGGGVSSGAFNNAATLEFGGGVHQLQAASSVSGPGTVRFDVGTVNVAGSYEITGTTSMTGATANFTGTVNEVGALVISAGTANFSSGELIEASTLNLSGGVLSGSDTVSVSGLSTWTGGTMSGTGTTTTDALNITGPTAKILSAGRTLSASGITNWSGSTSTNSNEIIVSGGASINNSGTWNDQNGHIVRLLNNGGAGSFDNDGTYTKSGVGQTQISIGFDNSGTLNIQTGTLNVSGPLTQTGTIDVASGATFQKLGGFTNANSGTLSGNGTFAVGAGTLTNAGRIEPGGNSPGSLTINGNLLLTSSSVIDFDLAGTGVGQFDVLNVTGTATLGSTPTLGGGTANIIHFGIPPFEPAILDSFLVIDSVGGSGTFATVTTPPGSAYTTVYVAGDVTFVRAALPILRIVDAVVAEGDAGSTQMTFTVNLTNELGQLITSSEIVNVNFSTSDGVAPGAATAPSDYIANSGLLIFNPGESTQTITVTVNGDEIVEAHERFFVNLSSATNAVIGDGEGTGTINNDDTATLTVEDESVVEGTGSGTTTLTFTVSLSAAVQDGFDITFSSGLLTAEAADFALLTASPLHFNGLVGETRTIAVDVARDAVVEANETFRIFLGNVSGTTTVQDAAITTGDTATGTIENDDTATLTVGDESVVEGTGSGGTTMLTFSVTSSTAVEGGFAVDFASLLGTAEVGDFTVSTLSPLHFAGTAGESQLIEVAITRDAVVEDHETFTVALGNVVAPSAVQDAAIATGDSATGTINNDDTSILTITSATNTEGNDGVAGLTFIVASSAEVEGGFTVAFANADGTATSPDDYTVTTVSPLTFSGAEGEAHSISANIFEDLSDEGPDQFTITLGAVEGTTAVQSAAIVTGAVGTGTINDNDTATARVYNAGAAGDYTIRLSGGSIQIFQGALLQTSEGLDDFSLTFNAAPGGNTLAIDFAGGDPVPSGGITFNGGAGSDTLVLLGGAFNTIEHTFASASSGSVALDGSLVTYTGLEPVLDNNDAANRIFTFTGGTESITLTDAAGTSMTIDSILGESVTFANPTSSLTINSGTGNDTVAINSVDAAYDASLTINGGDGTDSISLNTFLNLIAGGGTLSLSAETIAVDAAISATGNLTINAGNLAVHALVTTGSQSITATGDVTVAAFSNAAGLVASGSQTIAAGGTLTAQAGGGTGISARIVGGVGQTIGASSIVLTGGGVGDASFAEILQTGLGAGQSIDASSITITGAQSGTNNFARIRNDGTGTQTVEVAGPLSLSGGAGGALDQGNFAQIRAVGPQIIEAGHTTLAGGVTGASNSATIESPDQDITIHGNLTLTGGGSVVGTIHSGGARIGGLGGDDDTRGPTNLTLTVLDGNVSMTGGNTLNAAAVIGNSFQGGQTTNITMDVGDLTLTPGTVANSAARIGSPSAALADGEIKITADNITLNGSTINGIIGTVIRTQGDLTLQAGTITIGGGAVSSGVQTVTATGGLTVRGTTPGGVTTQLVAEGGQTINAQYVEVLAQGGSALIQNSLSGAQVITTTGTNAAGHSLRVASLGSGAASILQSAPSVLPEIALQEISATGTLTVAGGGAGTNRSAQITSSGGQDITAAGIAIIGGSGGTNNFADIRQTGIGADQAITVTGGGTLSMQGGLGGVDNFARIRNDGVNQEIDFPAGGAIVLTGGNGPDVPPDPLDTANNFARIENRSLTGLQTIDTGTIDLNGGITGANNFTGIQAAHQDITTTGDVTLQGGPAENSGSRIGAVGNTSSTDVALHVGGDLTLTAGSVGDAVIGANQAGDQITAILIEVDGDFIADGAAGGGVRIGSPEVDVAGGDIEIHAGLGVAGGDIVFSGRAQLRTLGEVTLTTPGTLALTGGSTGSGNAALIESDGDQTISAHTIALTGGAEGALDLGNFARITSVLGLQTITAGSLTTPGAMTLTAGASGINNYASITGPNQVITVHGDLTLTGGGSAASEFTGGAARIGGLGGEFPGPTNLELTVDGNVIMTGGNAEHAGAVIGNTFHGAQPTDIEMSVGGNLTLNPSTVPDSAARIGSRSEALGGGDIAITVGGDVTFNAAVNPGFAATVIRTADSLMLEAGGSITINGGAISSGEQTIIAGGNISLVVTGANNASVSATGMQTITAAGTLTVQGGAGTDLSARIVSSGGQTVTASSINVTGGSVGSSSFAEILQTGATGTQEIDASSITITGGSDGANNFARIRNNGTGDQTVDVTGPLSLTGGTEGAPDNGNNVQIRAAGSQFITAGATTLTAGANGFSNGANITSPNQVITINGALTLTGRGSASGLVSGGGARIGGVGAIMTGGGMIVPPGPTNLTLNVSEDVTLTGGSVAIAAIGSANLGGTAPATITMTVGGSVTLDSLGAEARIGTSSSNPAIGNITINAGTSGVGNITINGGTGIHTLDQIAISTPGSLTLTGGMGANRPAQILSEGNQTIDASSITLTGGSVGNSSFAQILQTGALGIQTIDASSIKINGGISGEDNFARIRNDATDVDADPADVDVVQRITGSPVITITGGTGGAPDEGNFAQIRALGLQEITAGNTTITAGGAGFSNFAGIHSPDQDITIHGTLTLTGGSSVAGPTSGGGARIGGIGGEIASPTNLDLKVEDSVTMNGGTEVFAGAVIGSSFTGGQTTDITMLVGGSLTMNPGTVSNSGARIGSPSTNPTGGDILITAGANITMGGSLAVGALGTVIRTIGGEVTLDAGGAITIAGSVFSGAQTVSAGGNIAISATGVTSATLNATGPQTITAGGALTVQGGAGTGLSAQIFGGNSQTINASSITVVGGSVGNSSFAQILQTGATESQTIDASSITINGGASGTDNFANISGANQLITVTGNVTLTSGTGAGNGPRIGGLGGIATNLVLNASGNVVLQGGNSANTAPAIGNPTVPIQMDTNIVINAGGDVILNAGSATGARIGSSANFPAGGGDISISAGGDIQLNGTAQVARIRTLGNVTLHADGPGGTISEGLNGLIQANLLTTTSHGDTTLIGPNQVTAFNGSSVSGNITLNNTSPLLTVTGISQASSAALVLSQVGNLTFTGNAFSGTQTISATGNITISPLDGLGLSVSAAGLQTVNAGGGLIVLQGNAAGSAQLTASGGQTINAQYVEVIAQGGGAFIQNNVSGTQLISTHGTNAVGQGLSLSSLFGGSAIISQNVAGGTQEITVTNADRVTLDTPGGGVASILTALNGTQTLSITGAGSNALVLGNPGSLGISQIVGAFQTIVAGSTEEEEAGSITITGRSADSLGNSIIVTSAVADGSQIVSTSGTLSVFGGSASTGDRAGVFANGDGGQQIISARSLLLQGGASGTGNRAEVAANRGSQTVTVGDGGISLTGGTGGTNNQAAIRQGVSPGVLTPEPQPGSQTVTVIGGGITLQGGSGTGNGASIAGTVQDIFATGSVTLNSSVSSGNSAASIGSVSGRPTNLELHAGGNVVLTGGAANSAAFIGSAGTIPGQPNSITIDAGGSVILNIGAGSGARIGSSTAAAAAAGDISISADGDIQLNSSTTQVARIRTLGNVTLDADGSISETFTGQVEANVLTTTSGSGTILTGPNQVAVFNATNTTSGNVTLVDVDGLTVTGISNPVGDITVSTTGQMTVTGSLDSGTHDMSLTAPGGVVFTASAVVNVDLGGTAANQFTNITISNAVTLDGTLDADLVNGFVPAAGNRFQFMTFASQGGSFDATNLPPDFTLESNPTFLELVFAAATPSISINDVSLLEGNSGVTSFTFTASLSNASSQAVTVNFATADGTATLAGNDYQGGAGSVTFAPGQTSQLISVLVNGDTSFEPDETFAVNLSGAVNATIADGTGLGTIRNDDNQPSISINDVSLLEGNSGVTSFTFTASLSNASAQAVTVNFATADGSATLASNDYQGAGGTVTFAPGQTSQLISVLVNGDVVFEPDETFTVNLSGAVNAAIADGTGLGTIRNDDAATGGIDLVGAVEWDPDDLLIPGDRERVTVRVSNIGDTAVHDQVTVKLYASTDTVFDASDVFLDDGHTGGNIQPGGSKSAHMNFRFPGTLLSGEYFLLAVVDPDNEIAESNEANNTAIGESFDFESFDFHRMFGQVPGHGWETLTVRDADGTWVNFSLIGPGTAEITIENGEWDLVVTGTTGSSVLSILTLGGGDHRVALDDIHVTGALRGILAPRMDLTGTLAIDGALGAGMMIGSATNAVIAVETILGTRLLGLGVQGIAILGDLKNSEILIGADLGADGQLGGSDAAADTYSAGDLGDLLITGSMISSCVLLDGSIDSITILGQMSDYSLFVASDLPRYARIDGKKVNTATDPRFWDTPPSSDSSGAGADCGIDWNAHAGSGWGAGYSPFATRTGSGQSNFSDFLVKLFG